MNKEKSYYLIYKGDIEKVLKEQNINKYIILNSQLASIYVDENFNEDILNSTVEITWWAESTPMSSLINITNNLEKGETIEDAVGTEYITNNPYVKVNGKGVLVAIIDSGVDYLNKDLINEDGSSKIEYLWDQESNKKGPPTNMLFGSEFTNEDINKAIKENDSSLSKDTIGTGTAIAGIIAGEGNINPKYKGIAPGSKLVVVKLKSYEGVYHKDKISYSFTDFLAALTYVIGIARRKQMPMIINLTIGSRSASTLEASILDTYPIFNRPGIILVGGAGDQGNTDIHYTGNFKKSLEKYQDITIQNTDNYNLDITITATGPDKLGVRVISPSGELSQDIQYSPDNNIYKGKFNLEDTLYRIVYVYPWIESGEELININLINIKPGIWTVRLNPEFIINGEYNIYLPNENLISKDTRFIDPNSMATITKYGVSDGVITIGVYDDKINSIWIGSSKGNPNDYMIKPDIVAPGVNIISTYINVEYNTFTGSGVSSSIVCGVLALVIEYLMKESNIPKLSLYNEVLKTYLMIGTTQKDIYDYPNISEGYGILNLRNLFKQIAENI